MTEQLFKDVFDEGLAEGAIINDRHTGHREDYIIIHCLLKKYKPKTFFEVGTNSGYGTLIIKNALGEDSVVYSLDLPDDEAYKSNQHPLNEGKQGVGYECTLPYVQLRGDSRQFNYWSYPCEGYFVDSDHDRNHVFTETCLILLERPNIIIFHDADEWEVFKAIFDAFSDEKDYELFRITDTRIIYAILKSLE